MSLDTYDKVAHVLRRAGFGAHPDEIDRKVAEGLEATVNELVDFETTPDNLAALPAAPNGSNYLDMTPEEFRELQGPFILDLSRWWLNTMVTTTRPLQEKMVLFWHQLFATSILGVGDRRQMYLQIENFRGNFEPDTGQIVRANPASPFPVGNFRLILEYLTKDPAMLYWLDNRLNRKLDSEVGTNENYAREVHELFSMGVVDAVTGEPNYTERDIRQASRALTGWTVRPAGRRGGSGDTLPRTFLFRSNDHDFGPYEHLGKIGGTNADFIFDNIVAHRNPGQPQSAVGRFLGMRLFRFFAYHDPEPEIINALADVFDGRDGQEPYHIRNMLRTIFLPGNPVSEAFYSESSFKAHVKSPTELLVGGFRLLNFDRQAGRPDDLPQIIARGRAGNVDALPRVLDPHLTQMGQRLMYPDDVSGWKEGANWINTTSALARFNFANQLATGFQLGDRGGRVQVGKVIDATRLLTQANLANASHEEIVDYFIRLLLQSPVSPEIRQALIEYLSAPSQNASDNGDFVNMKIPGLIHLIMTTADFQLS